MLRLAALFLLVLSSSLAAQERRPSHCFAFAQNVPGVEYLQKASFRDPVPEFSVRLNYIAHATFLLQTRGGLSVATDYTGFLGMTDFLPTVVTMNNAHDTHWTAFPDPAIPHVLPGWPTDGIPADHYVDLGEMLVRNVTTDIRSRYGQGVEENQNSIFVFEVEGLCIGHLGHLHQEPSEAQYAALGRLDVVMAPVDGGYTLDLASMVRLLTRLRSSVVIPMHWFGPMNLERFLDGMSESFVIERTNASFLELSLRDLPSRPTVMVLRPQFLREPE